MMTWDVGTLTQFHQRFTVVFNQTDLTGSIPSSLSHGWQDKQPLKELWATGHVWWWLKWEPLVNSLPLIWRSSTYRWYFQICDLQTCCWNLSKWQGTSIMVPVMVAGWQALSGCHSCHWKLPLISIKPQVKATQRWSCNEDMILSSGRKVPVVRKYAVKLVLKWNIKNIGNCCQETMFQYGSQNFRWSSHHLIFMMGLSII